MATMVQGGMIAMDSVQMDLLAQPREPLEVLHDVFGHAGFRGQQEAVVRHVTAGGDAVVLFPTGAGKSICY